MNDARVKTLDPVASDRVERVLESLANHDHPAFCTVRSTLTWKAWVAEVERLRSENQCLSRTSVGLVFRPHAGSYAWLVALSSINSHVFLIDEDLGPEATNELAQRHGIAIVLDPGSDQGGKADLRGRPHEEEALSESARITLFTSGSTGLPKPVRHDWERLSRPVRLGQQSSPQRWLLTYRPHLYAGMQVFFHCLLNRGTLVIPEPGMSVENVIRLMHRHDVHFVSATPSYWRRLVTLGPSDALRSLSLEQITLGGEACDQALLEGLKSRFPRTRLVHIYATSELGRCFSVKDGRAGFPASYLEGVSDDGVQLKLEEGELHVRSANAMLGAVDSQNSAGQETRWISTGDMVERSGDRCHFVGRRSELINVGGNKVHPLRVEEVVQSVPGVADVRVFGKTSSLVGQMVACQFQVADGFDQESVKQQILHECRERLASHERPRHLEVVERIALSRADKKIRGSD